MDNVAAGVAVIWPHKHLKHGLLIVASVQNSQCVLQAPRLLCKIKDLWLLVHVCSLWGNLYALQLHKLAPKIIFWADMRLLCLVLTLLSAVFKLWEWCSVRDISEIRKNTGKYLCSSIREEMSRFLWRNKRVVASLNQPEESFTVWQLNQERTHLLNCKIHVNASLLQ